MRIETIGNATLYLGDALDILPKVDKCHAVVTDPPYSSGGFNEAGKASGSIGTTANRRILGDTLSTRGYCGLMRRVLAAADADAAYVFTDWRMWPYTSEIVELAGYRLRGMIVWDKGSAGMGARWKTQHELICWGTRVSSELGAGLGNVLSFKRSGNAHHPTEKPLPLIEALVRNCEGESVVDPFMGSGTTAIAAHIAGKRFVGIEKDPAHFDIACRRIEDAQRQARMFG